MGPRLRVMVREGAAHFQNHPWPLTSTQTCRAIQGRPGTARSPADIRGNGGPSVAVHHHSQPVRVIQAHLRSSRATLGHPGQLNPGLSRAAGQTKPSESSAGTQAQPGPSRNTQGYKTSRRQRPPQTTQGHLRPSRATHANRAMKAIQGHPGMPSASQSHAGPPMVTKG